MNDQTIRVGIIGAGSNTQTMHIPKLQAIPGVEIMGVCNRSVESGEKVAAAFNIPKVYAVWSDLIDDPDIDAVVIGTWPYLHCSITCEALAAGKHVLCEARMAMNASEARVMLDTYRGHPELVAQIVPSPFTLPYDRTIQRLIAEGTIGDVLAVDIVATSGSFIDKDSPMNWRQDIERSGMNTLLMGIWYEAMARWVGHATQVSAHGNVFQKTRKDEEGVLKAMHIPDHIDILATLACGAQSHMRFSAVTGSAPYSSDAFIYGSDGSLHLSTTAGKLSGATREDAMFKEIDIPENERAGWRVEEEFIGAIRGTETVTLTRLEDGVRYMEFTEAVNRSRNEGKRIAIDSI